MNQSAAFPVSPDDWNRDVGDRWVRFQQQLDRMLAPFSQAILFHAQPVPGQKIVEVGSGAGALSLAVASLVRPDGHVLAVDISEALLASARERAAESIPSIDFVLADAGTYSFPAAQFDHVVSRFGVMFFEQPVAAFANLRSALRPGGQITFACWRSVDRNPWMTLPLTATTSLFPEAQPPDPDAPGPFFFADESRVQAVLGQAGFRDIVATSFETDVLLGEGIHAVEEAASQALEVGALGRRLIGQPDSLKLQASELVRRAFEGLLREGRIFLPSAAWIVTAKA